MKIYLSFLLVFSPVVSALAQAQSPNATELLSLGRFQEATQLLRQNALQNPSLQTNFDAGYGYLRSGKPDSAQIWFEKGILMDEKRFPLNQTGLAIITLIQNDNTKANLKLEEVISRS